jgi:hypothetical protein
VALVSGTSWGSTVVQSSIANWEDPAPQRRSRPYFCRLPPMPRPIPIELYALIFRHVTRTAALCNLCTVSRVFRHEAERLLYHTIRLPKDRGRLISWCHIIVENPRLAMQVYSLSLPMRFAYGQPYADRVDYNLMLQELQHAITRALSSLSRLVELEIYYQSVGNDYLDPGIFCGHSFHLQVFEENLDYWYSTNHWLKFLSEQPGIQHWRSNISVGEAIDPDVLPLLTSAHFHSSALDILTRCPVIRALRVTRPGLGYSPRLVELKVFRHTLTNLSIVHSKRLIMELDIVRDAVPNIKFLALASKYGVGARVESLSEFY